MSFTEKIDVLDLIIKTMEDHEKVLDGLVAKMESMASKLESLVKKEAQA